MLGNLRHMNSDPGMMQVHKSMVRYAVAGSSLLCSAVVGCDVTRFELGQQYVLE